MAVYRQIHVSFWQDSFVLDLTAEEKYFYLYLMTNSKTNQIGIYEISKKIMEIESGYNMDTVSKLLKKFIDYKKILYSESTKELMLLNWCKYNWSSSPKVVSLVNKELKGVKNTDFAKEYIEQAKSQGYKIEKLSIEYLYSIDIETQKELEKEKEIEKEIAVADEAAEKNVIEIFESNIGNLTPFQIDDLFKWQDEVGKELVIFAVEHAAIKSAKYYGFVQNLLKDWTKHNIDSVDKAKNYEEQRRPVNKFQSGGAENEFAREGQEYSW
ncbi:DnaD domain-containing protein [Listeria seeligeri]|uniref:DnaD domain-containing protein n=1 Tax=Listeria seeligeri TaxID=1640 RepID=UPI001886E47C|nr:DnaD domain protein [Listeria seeligeri]MBF2642865.1 DnaD domain protein [Listeria seeligeri]